MKIEFLSQQTDVLLVRASRGKFWIEIFLVFRWHVIGFWFLLGSGKQPDVGDVLL